MSSIPQGSVLFLYYINDLPDGLTSTIHLFTDYTIIYVTVSSTSHADALQADLDHLAVWEARWMMEFYPARCQVLSITWKHKPFTHNYTFHGISLEHVSTAKYLGVTFTSDLCWNTHINNITNKTNRTLSFVRRNL